MSSEKTATAAGTVGELRFDPFAMLPFCGYHMGDYFEHWLAIGRREHANLPKIFQVNWFRKDTDGGFLWPGYGANSRVLAWIFRRCEGTARARETPIGLIPTQEDLDTTGLDLTPGALAHVCEVDDDELRAEVPHIRKHLAQFGTELPVELRLQLEHLEQRLQTRSSEQPGPRPVPLAGR
jgi:phosphoenolpyruvate carboxykinase (GTP)